MRRQCLWVPPALILAASLLGAPPASAKEGFGLMTKKAAPLTRVSPPAVFLMGTKIAVRVSQSGASGESLAQRLQSQLESELISRDSRLVVERDRPETLIEVTILNNNHGEQWERRTETRLRQAGKDSKGKPIMEPYQVEVNYKVVTHSFGAAYRVTDIARKGSLDGDSIQHTFKQDFREGNGAPESFSLEGTALGIVVERVARRITPSREAMKVLLPKGTLEDLGNLAEAGQWNRYLEALEQRTPGATPADESYRLYAIGTAYEALGYGADDADTTLKYLQQASIYYGKAIETNPKEKYFSQPYDSFVTRDPIPPPLQRVEAALVSYRRLKDFRDNYETHLASKAAESAKSLEGGKAAEEEGMNNAAVIQMVEAGLPQDVILTAINSASRPAFDVSPQGLIRLAEAKVDKKIILRIQEIANGKKSTAKPTVQKKKSGSGR